MNSTISDFIIIGLVILYMIVISLYTKNFANIYLNPKKSQIHFMITGFVGLIAIFRSNHNSEIRMSDLYLFAPILFLILLILCNMYMQNKYGRPLIPAHKYNMMSEATKDAVFLDYFLFFLINIIPIIMPLFIFYNILGRK